MKVCKNCGEMVGYFWGESIFTKRKILTHIIKPYFPIHNGVLAFFHHQVTEKCNKPEAIESNEELNKLGQ